MTKIKKDWELPAPPEPDDPEGWKPVVRLGRFIPFGYSQREDDPDILEPIPAELVLLEKAKTLIKSYSYREVAQWLSNESGRTISHEGLRKRIKIESQRKRDITNYEFYAERAKEASRKAKELSKRPGGIRV